MAMTPAAIPAQAPMVLEVDISPSDPLLSYFANTTGVVEIDRLTLVSPALQTMKDAGVKPVVPLVSQGELIGLLNLGARRSEQEDDVTLLVIERLLQAEAKMAEQWEMLAEFTIANAPGNERRAMQWVVDNLSGMSIPASQLERIKTAVAETTMNAMEHGNKYSTENPVEFQMLTSKKAILIRITDHGGGKSIPEYVQPDLEAKLDGLQSPRGWGLFLVQSMVDEMRVQTDQTHHTVELIFRLEV
jgi:anti-sigma regulatory factor (Ser/Thr protein kinase)